MSGNKMALDARGDIRKDMPSSAYKMGDEFKPFHPGASHVRPEWRDGWNACFIAAIAALQAEPQTEHCVDVHALLREAADQKAARTEQLPTEQDCISMMVQCRLRLLELGWTSGEYAPKDGKEFEGINPGFAGPSTYTHLGSGFFIASPGDWWPAPRPLVFRLPATPPKD